MNLWGKLFSFKGRVSRKGFWLAHLLLSPIFSVVILLIGVLSGFNEWFVLITAFLSILMGAAEFSFMIRRFHDIGKSGWAIFTAFVPVGSSTPLCLFWKKGVAGSNAYGPDPLLQNEGEIDNG